MIIVNSQPEHQKLSALIMLRQFPASQQTFHAVLRILYHKTGSLADWIHAQLTVTRRNQMCLLPIYFPAFRLNLSRKKFIKGTVV